MTNPTDWGATPVEPDDKKKDGPLAWGAAAVDAKPDDMDWGAWARTRGQKAVAGIVGMPRFAGDVNDAAVQWLARKLGVSEDTARKLGGAARLLVPGSSPALGPGLTAEETNAYI